MSDPGNSTGPPVGSGPDVSAALSTASLDTVHGLVDEIAALSTTFSSENAANRAELLAKTRALQLALETPRDTLIRHLWAEPTYFIALTICEEAGVWRAMAKDNPSPKRAEDIAGEVGMYVTLLRRLLRHLVAGGYVADAGEDIFAPTRFSKAMALPMIGGGYPLMSAVTYKAATGAPEWFKKSGYKPPNTPDNAPFQTGLGTDLNFWAYLGAYPQYAAQFGNHMAAYSQGRPRWMDSNFYPVKERLIDGFDQAPVTAFLVDIGGAIGHDLQAFLEQFPAVPGRLVLQDLPAVIESIKELNPRIERMAYDFRTEQPVKAARAYYLHSVLHDWPDSDCPTILANITAAMKPGYSRLLINENLVPDRDAYWETTALDVMLMILMAARERTGRDWEALLSSAGLRIVKVWSACHSAESLIECEVAEHPDQDPGPVEASDGECHM